MKNNTAATKTTTKTAAKASVKRAATQSAAATKAAAPAPVVPESAQPTEGMPGAGGGKKKAEPKKPAEIVLKVRLYAKGEFYFGKHAAARIGKMTHIALEAKGKTITLTPTKSEKDTHKLMYCHAAPVLRVKEALKNLGIVTLTTQDLVAKPVGENAFQLEVQ